MGDTKFKHFFWISKNLFLLTSINDSPSFKQMIAVDSRNVNLTVTNDAANIPYLFMDIILTYMNMIVYIYGKWLYTWGGDGDCSSK